METFEEISSLIRRNELGRRAFIQTPFGQRLLCYADLTATGRHLEFVENWLSRVRALYANTHTAVSSTGRIMTHLREQARAIVAQSVNAGSRDVVLFVGAGATSAVNKLIGLLGLRIAEPLDREFGLSGAIPRSQRPVVFVGPYEHHSNELPWLESVAELVEVGLEPSGRIDLGDLESKLASYSGRKLKIGTFSAASNVTGVLSDVRAIARVLHRGGAYACFDYAAAAPYVPIDMHPGPQDERIDAIFLSTHKFIGGPEGSGVLVANESLFRSRIPERPGGGTVDYVAAFDRLSVDYVRRMDEREEGGTPAILGDLRAGIAFLVKEIVGPQRILEHEMDIAERATARLSRHPRIKLLGPRNLPRLAILSFNIDGLHHDLVSALLDHLFGIQNRAGCSCAGPYGHRLLGIDRSQSERYRVQIANGFLGIKPGWVRLSLPYYASEEDLEFILRAVEFVADHGMDFVPVYRLGWMDGVWRHVDRPVPECAAIKLDLEALTKACREPTVAAPVALSDGEIRAERARYFAEAHRIAAELHARWQKEPCHWNPSVALEDLNSLCWFRFVHADNPWDSRARSGGTSLPAASP
jgi:selenocysteine lyase/cysteine desulfurase